jgi:hypothetical protein
MTSPLLNLPIELRLMIWQLVFEDCADLRYIPSSRKADDPAEPETRIFNRNSLTGPSNVPSLLLTCRQTYQEAWHPMIRQVKVDISGILKTDPDATMNAAHVKSCSQFSMSKSTCPSAAASRPCLFSTLPSVRRLSANAYAQDAQLEKCPACDVTVRSRILSSSFHRSSASDSWRIQSE